MEPFKTHRGKILTLDRANIDTDAIIPKQFLKSIRRTGYGENLFFDWRYLPDGRPNPDFELNKESAQGATILVAQNNFGCGSSREHAVWAVVQYGFKVVIAPKKEGIPAFADIFRNNSIKNGLLTIELSQDQVDVIFQNFEKNPKLEATIDLEKQKIMLHASKEIVFDFDIEKSIKEHLIQGLDEIGLSLQKSADIRTFEKNHNAQAYWS